MPLQSSGIIVVEKPTSTSSVCVSQQQQQLLFATTNTNATSSSKPITEIQYCEYYETSDVHTQQHQQQQQQKQHAVVVEHSSNSTPQQQQHLIRRQQQRSNPSNTSTTIQQLNLKQQQTVQHIAHHPQTPVPQQQQQHQQQAAPQVLQVSEELYEQAAAAAGNVMISTTGEVLNQQYFKIVTPDGNTSNMIIGPMANVTTATTGHSASAAVGTSNSAAKVLLSNVTVLSKQSAPSSVATQQQQQQQSHQTINFVSTKNVTYLTTTTTNVGGIAAGTTTNGKQQKLCSSVANYKTASIKHHQHVINNTSATSATAAFIQQSPQQLQQQHTVQKISVPRSVQMVARVQTLLPQTQQQQQQQQQQQMIIQQQQQPQQTQITQKYVVPSTASKTGNVLKKSGSLKMSQHKGLNNISQTGSIKTFIQQQQQQPMGNNNQQQQNNQYQTTNKIKSQKIVKQYNNVISNSAGAVSIATLPQQQQQHHTNHTALATYTINHKLNNHHQQQPTKITKIANSKYIIHNNQQQQQQQQQHHILTSTTATLPHGTQIHHKPLQQQQHQQQHNSNSNGGSNNIMLQQFNTNTHIAGSNAGTIKFVNAHGTIIHQQNHHQQQQQLPQPNSSQKQRHQQQHKQHQQQQYAQQLQFVEAPMNTENIYQMPATATPQQQSPASSTSSSCSQSLISDDIMIVNGTQMTDELSARILQSMAQNSFGNQQRYQQQQQQQQQKQQQHQHQVKGATSASIPSTTNMPPPHQIVLQQHGTNVSSVPHHQMLSPKEYPIYNPLQHQQQQYVQAQQPTSYLGSSCSSALASGVTANNGGNSSGVLSTRQNQSAPTSRSHSMERKIYEPSSVAKKSSEYFKVNTSEIVQALSHESTTSTAFSTSPLIDIIPLHPCRNSNNMPQQRGSGSGMHSAITNSNAGVCLDVQATVAAKTTINNASAVNSDDDIIGEEVRPVPVNTQDMRLWILHAVLQDHTYANPTPTRISTELSATATSGCQSITDSLQIYSASNSSGYGTSQSQTTITTTAGAATQQWSLGGIGVTVGQNVGVAGTASDGNAAAASGALVTTTLNAQTLITSGGGTTSYTLYGQQIPRVQQDDDANSAISNGSRVATGDIDPGEETETAAEAEDDSVTRCICDLTHDDGYMICCDKCSAWQHVDCMGIDRQNIPDEYLCEVCQPRPVDKDRARALQLMKRKEQQAHLLLNSQASTGGMCDGNSINIGGNGIGNEGLAQHHRLGAAACGGLLFSNSNDMTGRGGALPNSIHAGAMGPANKKGKVLKKMKESAGATNRKLKKAEKASGGSGKVSRKETKKNTRRKTKNIDSIGSGGGGTAAERHAALLRQWIESYESAMTNHYSPELRARLQALSKHPNFPLSSENKALKNCGNLEFKASTVPHAGGKILVSNLDIGPNCPIFELRGKFMLTTQFRMQNSTLNMNSPPPSNYMAGFKPHRIPGPFIFFYQLPDSEFDAQLQALPPPSQASSPLQMKGPEICVDTRTYGNEARFVRRSCRPNAEIQHLFEKGTIHLFIVSLSDIRASTEITIRHEPHDLLAIEHRKSSQLVIQPTSTPCACGLSKDCLFGPPLHQAPMASAALKPGRKALTLNGSSAAALQLTMGGLPAPGTPPSTKKKSQSFNRNRSTSSSGDSNTGLNSPNILPLSGSVHNTNTKNANIFGSGVPFITAASATATQSNPMHDSGICTSSSSPSVSIPSPSSHIHSPTQQQQQQQQHQQNHCLQPIQQTPTPAVVQQRNLGMLQTPTQSQQRYSQQLQQHQHQQILAALPTPMLLSPHQVMSQQRADQVVGQTLNTVAANVTETDALMATSMMQPNEEQLQDQELTSSDAVQESKDVLAKIDGQTKSPIIDSNVPLCQMDRSDITNMFTTHSHSIASSLVPATPTYPNKTISVAQHQLSSVFSNSEITTPTLAANETFDAAQQQQQQIHLHQQQQQQTPQPNSYQQTLTSPIMSPQKAVNTSGTSANTSARKGSARQQNVSRTTSMCEDNSAAAPSDHQAHLDGDTMASTQSPNSSSNNTSLTSPKEKPKLTRDERKMEAIIRAIEKMERSSQRKQEPKQTRRVTKRRQSNNSNISSTLLDKQRIGGDGNAVSLESNGNSGGAKQAKKSSSGYSSSRKKKRKSHRKSYSMQSTAAQRKRLKSRMDSNESAVEAADNAEIMVANTTDADIGPIKATSESESSSQLSPSVQTMGAGGSDEYNVHCPQQEQQQHQHQQQRFEGNAEGEEQHLTNDCNSPIGNKCDDSSAVTNVDHAAGLLMAFANPKNSVISSHEIDDQRNLVAHSPMQYILHDDVFKSPNRLQLTRDSTVGASPPPTPPASVSSACMLLEAAVGPLEPLDNQASGVEFKYPTSTQTKTKKILMSNWFHQSDVSDINSASDVITQQPHSQAFSDPPVSTMGLDSLVQAAMSDYKPQEEVKNLSMAAKQVEEFIQQTECPLATDTEQPNICGNYMSTESYHQGLSAEPASSHYASAMTVAEHLHLPLQVSTCSNNSSVKKRWLRQAISEETDESSPTTPLSGGGVSIASPLPNNYPMLPNGFTTPLKKRRLVINSKEEDGENIGGACGLSMTPPPPSANTGSELAHSQPTTDSHIKLESAAYGNDINDRAVPRDNETEVVDVGNCEATNNFQSAVSETNFDNSEKVPASPFQPTSPTREEQSSPQLRADFKTEIALEQDDDVDILRSPSPDSQKMVAEDNLVKIEPEDVSGCDDVKIDVEREESVTFDKFEEMIESKQEAKTDHQKIEQALVDTKSEAVGNIKSEKQSGIPEEIKEEKFTKVTIPEFDIQMKSTDVHDLPSQQLSEISPTLDEPLNKKPKLELPHEIPSGQMPEVDTSTKTEASTSSPSKSAVPVETFLQSQSRLSPETPTQEVSKKTPIVDSRIPSCDAACESPSPVTPTLPESKSSIDACKPPEASSGNGNVNTRHSLSDDDIQERLHSFHKENILFLQSRNKKTKISLTSPPTRSSTTYKAESKHLSNECKNSSVLKRSTSSSLKSTHLSSSSRKLLKKEKSSKNISRSSTKNSDGADAENAAASSSYSSSVSRKIKAPTKSHSSTSLSNNFPSSVTSPSSSATSSAISSTSTTVATNHSERERNRCRSISTSSSSSCPHPFATTKKRQLNFEQELSKDMLMCGSSGNSSNSNSNSSSGKHRSHDTTSSFAKKRRDSLSGSFRGDDTRNNNINKYKPTSSSNFAHSDNSNIKKQSTGSTNPISLPANSTDDQINVPVVTTAVSEVSMATSINTIPNCALSSGEFSAYTQGLPKSIVASDVPNLPKLNTSPTATTTTTNTTSATTPTTSPIASKVTNSLPYYNTIYGKLLDNSRPQIPSSIEVIAGNSFSTPPSHSSGCPTMLSEYLDTKAKSYNTLGGYVSHTAALFGINAERKSTNNEADSIQLNSKATALASAMSSSLDLPIPAASSSSSCSTVMSVPKLSTPIKILTKTASHDPRLNPILSAPEPPPAPKRKLSINEYRKRKQQSFSTCDSLATSFMSSKEKLSAFLHASKKMSLSSLSKISSDLSSASSANTSNNSNGHNSSPPTNIYISTINKCTLNSPERFEIMRELHEKSLNESILNSSNSSSSNSSLSFANVEIPRMRSSEEDTSKVQFSAAPTLLEKQQENLCERLKSLKNKQSAADLVTGRLAAIDKEFSLKKDNNHLFHNRSNTSDLDNCLEEISSSSTSMTSSRESTPERQCHLRQVSPFNRQYNEAVSNESDDDDCDHQRQRSGAVGGAVPSKKVAAHVETTTATTTTLTSTSISLSTIPSKPLPTGMPSPRTPSTTTPSSATLSSTTSLATTLSQTILSLVTPPTTMTTTVTATSMPSTITPSTTTLSTSLAKRSNNYDLK